MEKKVSARVLVSGRVQGVYFRMETRQAAERYGVSGWVRNKRDGTVEALFEGSQTQVAGILEWCEKGPPLARVQDVDIHWGEYSGAFDHFEVRY